VALHADHLVLPISQGEEQIGAISVDRGAVAGLQNERHHLLSDVADSLGAILQASRLGIELERQLRAALAHAEEIAVCRGGPRWPRWTTSGVRSSGTCTTAPSTTW